MQTMTKRERVMAAIEGKEVDHIPLSMWYHLPQYDQDPIALAEEQIRLEDQSSNTMENLVFSRELLAREGIEVEETDVLVVSNGFHLTRARMLAGRFRYGEISTLAAPSSHLPSRLYMYIREPLALVKSFLLDR